MAIQSGDFFRWNPKPRLKDGVLIDYKGKNPWMPMIRSLNKGMSDDEIALVLYDL